MFLRTVELAFARFQARRDARALAIVFDRTAPELLRVARHLASTEVDAEDLVQATFVQAIESAASHRRGEPVLPWLLGILANQARSARRRARRQPDPSRLRGEVVRDALTEVEGNELGAALQAAIARLPEVYRPVLRMSLELGLEAQEIAHALERPAGTVRAQVSRGLDLLRKALPVGIASGVAVTMTAGRGLAAVRQSVLGSCAGTSTGLVATLALGGIVVLHHKLLAAGVALALAFVFWSALGGPPEDQPALANESAARGGAVAVIDRPNEAPPLPQVARDLATAVAPPPPGSTVVAPEVGDLLVELVSATDGAPLAGVGVCVQHADERASFGRQSKWLTTDAHGRVHFTGLRPAVWYIDVDRQGSIAAGDVVAGETVRRRVEVQVGVRVAGVVVDEADRPVADAAILVHGNRLAAPTVARSDAQGRFVVEHLLPKQHLQARRAGFTPSAVRLVEGALAGEVAMTLRVRAGGRRIAGRVLGPDAMPRAGVAVAVVAADAVHVDFWDATKEQQRPVYLATDADGAFAVDEVGSARQLVLAMPEGGECATAWTFVEAGPGEAFATVHLPRAAVLAGRILGVEDPTTVTVQALQTDAAPIGFLGNLAAMHVATAAADGTYRLAGLGAGRCQVFARQGFEVIGQKEITLAAGEVRTWDIDRAEVGDVVPLRVKVQAPTPLPAGLFVVVGPHVPDGSAPSIVPLDATGAARVELRRASGVDVVLTQFPGLQQVVQLARRGDVPIGVDAVTLELDAAQVPTRRVLGRLVDASGAPVPDTVVSVAQVTVDQRIVCVEATTDADGRFATIALPSGTYQLSVGGSMAAGRAIGVAVLTTARDEDVGNLEAKG